MKKNPPSSRVLEVREHGVEDRAQPGHVLVAPAQLQHLEQRVGQVGVVVQIGVEKRDAVLGGGEQASVAPQALGAGNRARARRAAPNSGLPSARAAAGQAADRQRVPAGQDLVVEPGPERACCGSRVVWRAPSRAGCCTSAGSSAELRRDLARYDTKHVQVPRAFEVRRLVEAEAPR